MDNSMYESWIDTVDSSVETDLTDYLNLGTGLIIEYDGIFERIPFVNTAIGLFKISKSVLEINHINQLYIFINEIKINLADEEKRKKYIRLFKEKGQKARNKELEYVILITSRYLTQDKSVLLGRLYLSYLNKDITWIEFVSYSEIIDRFLPGDYDTLTQGNQLDVDDNDLSDSLLRLTSHGLYRSVAQELKAPTTVGSILIPASRVKDYVITPYGEKMRKALERYL